MTFHCLISMFVIIILNINGVTGSKILLNAQKFHKPYSTFAKAKSSFRAPDKTEWNKPHENLMRSIRLVTNQNIKSRHPHNEALLIYKLFKKIQKELFAGDIRMFDLSVISNIKSLSQQGKKADFKYKTYDWLARNKSLIKGFVGELDANNLMLFSGYEGLPCRLASNQGIDHVFIKYAKKLEIENIVIMESKYIYPGGRIKLSKSSTGVQQLSSGWLNKQIAVLRTSKLHQKTLKILEENKDKIQLHGYFIFADGQKAWRDYGRFDYHSPTCKLAKRRASCCPFPLPVSSSHKTINTTRTKRSSRIKLFRGSKRKSQIFPIQ